MCDNHFRDSDTVNLRAVAVSAAQCEVVSSEPSPVASPTPMTPAYMMWGDG